MSYPNRSLQEEVLRRLPGSWIAQRGGRWFVFRPDDFIGEVSIGSGATIDEAWADVYALQRKHQGSRAPQGEGS